MTVTCVSNVEQNHGIARLDVVDVLLHESVADELDRPHAGELGQREPAEVDVGLHGTELQVEVHRHTARELEVKWSDFGMDGSDIQAILFAGPAAGPATFHIDDVRLN